MRFNDVDWSSRQGKGVVSCWPLEDRCRWSTKGQESAENHDQLTSSTCWRDHPRRGRLRELVSDKQKFPFFSFYYSFFTLLFCSEFFFFFFYIPIGKNREMACFFFLQMEKWSSWWWRGVAQKPIKKPTKPTQLSTLASLMIRRIVFAPCVRGATTKPGIRYTSDISLTPCPI